MDSAAMPDRDQAAAGLRALLRGGLPLTDPAAAGHLLQLRGVTARASGPEDEARMRALEGLLRWQLGRWDHELATATDLLFGAGETAGATLTRRREAAAQVLDRDVDHFRKRIEPKICDLVASLLLADAEAFGRARAEPPRLTRTRTRLRLEPDPFAWEACEHERMSSLLWAAVYALRADLLDLARRVSMTGSRADLNRAADAALYAYGRLLAAADAYRAAWGEQLLHADTSLAPRELARLAGWVPDLGPSGADQLSTAAAKAGTLTDFLDSVPTTVREDWHHAHTR
ncbi:hypothetical protein [Streptacidiphilus anmyonensis]|uniref:hypothetical protein n=1 Tax=Streptacidiphilus anmyonensis TaxID=405782 RepID=UPI0005A665A6|nr:hypothetical protein [Streptacidiphilus anmyonensis]